MPPEMKILTQFGNTVPFDENKIVKSLLHETELAEKFYGIPPISESQAKIVAAGAVEKLQAMQLDVLTGSLIREVVSTQLLLLGLKHYWNLYSRVGMPVFDAHQIDTGAEGNGDNANLQVNAETSHKRKADKMSKEQYLRMMPPELAEKHLTGDLHIHDLEYFGTRSFCMDWDLRYFFYYGLMPDGAGVKASVAGPAKRAEVAILHAVKALGSAQTNYAGGQGYYNFLTFIAPYLVNLSYKEIKQLMQMFVYEMTQMMVARGGQSLKGNSLIVIRDVKTGNVKIVQIGDFSHRYLPGEGTHLFDGEMYQTLSLNKKTGDLEWKPITGVYVHIPATQIVTTTLHDGRTVTTTNDHSLFTLDENNNFTEIKPKTNPTTIITTETIPMKPSTHLDEDTMFFIGVCIGDGNLVDNNSIESSAIRLCPSDPAVRERVDRAVKKYIDSNYTWGQYGSSGVISTGIPTTGIPFIKEIGIGANNKQIPEALLCVSEPSLRALLDGLLSTDGNLSRNRYEYTTTSKKLANQIEFILLRLGMKYNIGKSWKSSNFKRNYPVWKIQISTKDSQNIKVTHSSRQIVTNECIEQNHHTFSVIRPMIKERLLKLSDCNYAFKSSSRKLKKKDIESVKEIVPDIWGKICNILPSEVKSIIPANEEQYVYDIGVKDNENFVLHNGIVAHNTVFSSVQLSPGVPALWKDKPVVAFGKVYDNWTYGELETQVRLAFKALMEVMLEGDAGGKPFNFPKPEISIEPQFLQEDETFNRWKDSGTPTYEELYLMAFELASKYGTPYFDNQIPAYRGAGEGISCYQCLPEETLVHVKRRNKKIIVPIKDLKETDQILTPDLGYQSFQGILIKSYTGDILEFILETGQSFRCTPDHSVPIMRDAHSGSQFVSANEVLLTDQIAVRIEGQWTWVSIEIINTLVDYTGMVYDPINVAGHVFVIEDGIATGNCCAYQFSKTLENDNLFEDKLYFRDGKHFSMGSWAVVSLNCPRAAYRANGNDAALIANLKELMDTAVEIFRVKKAWMDEIIARGRIPFAMQRPVDPDTGERGEIAVDFDGLVYTIGVVGINEMIKAHCGASMHENPRAWKKAVAVMMELKKYAQALSQEHGIEIALARTPAETTGQRFAVMDLLHPDYKLSAVENVQGDFVTATKMQDYTQDLPIYYTNGTHIPPNAKVSIGERARLEHIFFPVVDGGNIFHIWLAEERPDPRGLMETAMKLCKTTQIGYFAFTRDLTVPLHQWSDYILEV